MTYRIIIPVYRDAEGLRQTLAALATEEGFDERSVVVVADGEDQKVIGVAENFGVCCRAYAPNRGSYYARNFGVADAAEELLLFLDAGVIPEPEWLGRMLQGLKHNDYVAGGIGFPPSRARITWAEAYQLVHGFPVAWYFREKKFGPTANIGVRRVMFEKVGGFNASLRSGGDEDFGRRLHSAGAKMDYRTDARVRHDFRNLRELVEKQRRVNLGRRDLASRSGEAPWMARPLPNLLRRIVPPLRLPVREDAPSSALIRLKALTVAYYLRIRCGR